MPLEPLSPRATIGILGGGQLGRFLAIAAANLGLKAAIYAAEDDCPAIQVASRYVHAPYNDEAALIAFAKSCDVITFEFENVPSHALQIAGRHAEIRPSARAAAIAQNRVSEKRFLSSLDIPVAPYAVIEVEDDLIAASSLLEGNLPAILKRAREGYDGKGQKPVSSIEELKEALADLGSPCVLERRVHFETEMSVIAVRSAAGRTLCYDCPENSHRDGILRSSKVPASSSDRHQALAKDIAGHVAGSLGYCGVLGIEFFVMPEESSTPLLVNEIAPRVHNSGHWTLDACAASQFENHIRAVAGWPLAAVSRHSDAVMTNLIGPDIEKWHQIMEEEPGACLYLYGKTGIREGRKLGHVTRISPLKPK